MTTNPKIFIGCSANHEDAESQVVLEYTLRSKSSLPLDITWMKLSRNPGSPFYSDGENGWNTSIWATPFSGFRWAVPELTGFQGKAIYMDSDMIVMSDIAELWNQEFEHGKVVMAKGMNATWRYCVSLWRCDAVSDFLPPITDMQKDVNAHNKLMSLFRGRPDLTQTFRGNWNCLDGEQYQSLYDPAIKCIHYTSVPHQVHLPLAQERLAKKGRSHWYTGAVKRHWREDLIQLFNTELEEAMEDGYPVELYEQDELYGPYNKKNTDHMKNEIPHWGMRA